MWDVYDRELFMLLLVTALLWIRQCSESGSKNKSIADVHPEKVYVQRLLKTLNEDYFRLSLFMPRKVIHCFFVSCLKGVGLPAGPVLLSVFSLPTVYKEKITVTLTVQLYFLCFHV